MRLKGKLVAAQGTEELSSHFETKPFTPNDDNFKITYQNVPEYSSIEWIFCQFKDLFFKKSSPIKGNYYEV
jgi:hypothetical protein